MNLKKILVLAAVAFVIFMLVTYPEQSAAAVRYTLHTLRVVAEALITFVRQLFAGS